MLCSFYIPSLFLLERVGASFFDPFLCSQCCLCMCKRDSLWKIHWLAWLVGWCDKARCSQPRTQNENVPKFGPRQPPERESTFKYSAGKIWAFLPCALTKSEEHSYGPSVAVCLPTEPKFRRLENKSLRELLLSVYSKLLSHLLKAGDET